MFRRTVFAVLFLIAVSYPARAQNTFVDDSPHKSGFVHVNGVRLHYLDWGGSGKTLVFLAGLGNSAHVFDDIAPEFTGEYHVIAITRRGHGESDKPADGYDLPTLVEDIRLALDSLHIPKATLVGHSFAGDELTLFATKYPKRVDKLVYLEAAYDRSLTPPPNPHPNARPTKDDVGSFDAFRSYWQRTRGYWSDAVEADLRATSLAEDGSIKGALSREAVQGIMKNAQDYPATYFHIAAPVLAFYNVPEDAARHEYEQQNILKLKAEHPKHLVIVELDHSNHYIFITNQKEVLKEMRRFLD